MIQFFRQEPMRVEGSRLLSPRLQRPKIPTLPRKAPSQEPVDAVTRGLDAGLSAADEALAEILEAVRCMLRAVKAEVEGFEVSCERIPGRVEGAAYRILFSGQLRRGFQLLLE